MFVRHAQSVANAGGITMPHRQIPLSAIGERQAHLLARAFAAPPAGVLVSSMLRTHQTAAPLCRRFGLDPQVEASLDEFSVIDPALIAGLDGPGRRPLAQAFWEDPDPLRRLGIDSDTFLEFADRVCAFLALAPSLPDSTLVVGHGIWFGMLLWLISGGEVGDAAAMLRFRSFQQALPMPNCAAFDLVRSDDGRWSATANEALTKSAVPPSVRD